MLASFDHTFFMQRALQLAEHALFDATPNPRVGCCIVKEGKMIGEGFTQKPGQAHAEIMALQDAKTRGHDVRGATLYVSLEPCSHFGRTPPCVDAIIAAGITHVVGAVVDPNLKVSGQGFARLKAAGITVTEGCCAQEAKKINAGFFSRMQKNRPWIRLKMAMSVDGKTALNNGQSQWITGDKARQDNQYWRARSCAVLTGSGTVLADDPLLNVRNLPNQKTITRQPIRIVLDTHMRISETARIFNADPVWLLASEINHEKRAALRAKNVEVFALKAKEEGINLQELMQLCVKHELNEIHVEAGRTLSSAFLQAGLVDELLIYMAPRVLGSGRPLFDCAQIHELKNAWNFRFESVLQVAEDLRLMLSREKYV